MVSRTTSHACKGGWVAWVALVMLAGCGVGVGGTGSGTDDGGNDPIEFTPAGLCAAPFAETNLACPPNIKDPDRGTAAVQWADANKSNEGAAVLAVLEGNAMSLQVPCSEVTFTGRWGELEDGTLAFVGRYVGPDTIDARSAITRVTEVPNEPDAVGQLQVLDASGSTLFGPWVVRRVDGEVRFDACVR